MQKIKKSMIVFLSICLISTMTAFPVFAQENAAVEPVGQDVTEELLLTEEEAADVTEEILTEEIPEEVTEEETTVEETTAEETVVEETTAEEITEELPAAAVSEEVALEAETKAAKEETTVAQKTKAAKKTTATKKATAKKTTAKKTTDTALSKEVKLSLQDADTAEKEAVSAKPPANGWYSADGKTYYYKKNVMQTGWQQISGKWYYFKKGSKGGQMLTGWQQIGTGKYYLDPKTGVMQTGWKKLDGKWYYFKGGNSGRMQTGWITLKNKTYYLNTKTGELFTGSHKIDGKLYYFKTGNSGMLVNGKGWKKLDGKWYYYNSDSTTLKTGWLKLGDYWYYLKSDGSMATGWQKVGGKWYLLKDGNSGRMQTGWHKVDGKWYYMASSGVMQTGWLTWKGNAYYLKKNGVMATGKVQEGSALLTFRSNGVYTGECEFVYDKDNIIIMLDAGHDETHVGASSGKYHEEEMTIAIAKACKEELEKYDNITVLMSRDSEECPYPDEDEIGDIYCRIAAAKEQNTCMYISLHINAWGGSQRGVLLIPQIPTWKTGLSEAGTAVGEAMRDELLKLGFKDNGTWYRYTTTDETWPDGSAADYYAVTHGGKQASLASLIVEHGFIDNDDVKLLNSAKKLKKIGIADATGIAAYFGLKKKTK